MMGVNTGHAMFGSQEGRSEMGIGIGWFIGRVAKLDMMVGSATNRRSEREAVVLVVVGDMVQQRLAVIGECSRRRPGMEANSGQRDRRLY